MKLETNFIYEYNERKLDEFTFRQWRFQMSDHYFVSAICHTEGNHILSYGNKKSPYEMALIYIHDDEFDCVDEIIPFCDNADVNAILTFLSEEETDEGIKTLWVKLRKYKEH